MSTTSRRERDREQRREAANHRIGHDNAYRIIYGPAWFKLGAVALAGLGVAWTWQHVDFRWVSLAIGVLGLAILIAYAVWVVRSGSMFERQMRRARGETLAFGWHLAGAAGACLLIAAALIWRSA